VWVLLPYLRVLKTAVWVGVVPVDEIAAERYGC